MRKVGIIMKRNDFKKVVKAFSFWKIDKRKGNYKLPNGNLLSDYLSDLVSELLANNHLAFRSNGDLGEIINNKIFVEFADDEEIGNQDKYIKEFVDELIY